MDINQAARLIEWLDEERRRDKATIATLEERLAQQQDTIDTLGSGSTAWSRPDRCAAAPPMA
jgi:hypothetical protein